MLIENSPDCCCDYPLRIYTWTTHTWPQVYRDWGQALIIDLYTSQHRLSLHITWGFFIVITSCTKKTKSCHNDWKHCRLSLLMAKMSSWHSFHCGSHVNLELFRMSILHWDPQHQCPINDVIRQSCREKAGIMSASSLCGQYATSSVHLSFYLAHYLRLLICQKCQFTLIFATGFQNTRNDPGIFQL